ncbi:hypothetical protein [Actinoplanes utahensis]|uniref:Uncharacterized protein n=1 Tax=Actinoplanes utahensis TaxID=1869 RepID=A0A0A6US04_ACTUT|nr:hypothetical protein [Actinoplanes utahensis]KHD78900.1 hypothetical protein MB27_02000 [Actinoplanes utahensis]GIF28147.1 hypothetical protein Aut01nite_11330 [Actinoplanes utahensis]
MKPRDFPPGVVLHAPHCPDAGDGNKATLPTLKAIADYPSFRWCLCGNLDDTPHVVVEAIDYGLHLYEPAPGVPPRDAIRPLCKTCRGTHGPATSGVVAS